MESEQVRLMPFGGHSAQLDTCIWVFAVAKAQQVTIDISLNLHPIAPPVSSRSVTLNRVPGSMANPKWPVSESCHDLSDASNHCVKDTEKRRSHFGLSRAVLSFTEFDNSTGHTFPYDLRYVTASIVGLRSAIATSNVIDVFGVDVIQPGLPGLSSTSAQPSLAE